MLQSAIHADLEAEFAAVAESAGCELVHAEFCGDKLRVFLDRPEGVTLEHCETVSRQLSALLDVHDFGKRRYFLEVSSPGLDRKLYRSADYERFRGHLARITFREAGSPEAGGVAKRTIVGRLEELRPGEQAGEERITVAESSTGEHHQIALRDIQVARLEIEL